MNKQIAILIRKALFAMVLALYLVAGMQLWPIVRWITGSPLVWIGGADALTFSLFMTGGLFGFGFVVLALIPARLLESARLPRQRVRWIDLAGVSLVLLGFWVGMTLVLVRAWPAAPADTFLVQGLAGTLATFLWAAGYYWVTVRLRRALLPLRRA